MQIVPYQLQADAVVKWHFVFVCLQYLTTFYMRQLCWSTHVIDVGWTSVRPSVRPSVTRWYCVSVSAALERWRVGFCCPAFPTLSTHRSAWCLTCWTFLSSMAGSLIPTWSRLPKPSAHSVIINLLKELLKIKIQRQKLLLQRVSFTELVLFSLCFIFH